MKDGHVRALEARLSAHRRVLALVLSAIAAYGAEMRVMRDAVK